MIFFSYLAAFLDPAALVISFLVLYYTPEKLGTITTILLATTLSYCFAEFMLNQSQGLRKFGDHFYIHYPAKLAVALIVFLLIRFVRKRRA